MIIQKKTQLASPAYGTGHLKTRQAQMAAQVKKT